MNDERTEPARPSANSGGPGIRELPSEAHIARPAAEIFDIIVDLAHQDRWLARSSAFKGTTEISTDPVRLGTTYREPGPAGVREGVVTEYDPPSSVAFDQPMTLRWRLGTLGVRVRYTLTAADGGTKVRRVCSLRVPTRLAPLKPLLARAFRAESARTLAALRAYAGRNGDGGS